MVRIGHRDCLLHLVELPYLTGSIRGGRSKDYRKVPIATIGDENVFGSDEIVHRLLKLPAVGDTLETKGGTTVSDFVESESSKRWLQYANDDLAVLLYPNICRTIADSYRAFGYVDQVETFSPLQRWTVRTAGSVAMYLAASRIKSKSITVPL